MRNVIATLLAASILAGHAFAADTSLAPGKPAGIRQAQNDSDNTLGYILGAGAVAAGIALVASGNSNNKTSPATTATSTQ